MCLPFFKKLSVQPNTRKVTDTFYGYNHNLKIADGEFYDTTNMTTELYPLMANRKKRNTYKDDLDYYGILGGDKLAWAEGVSVEGDIVPEIWLFYDGLPVLKLAHSTETEAYAIRQLVRMGSYICVFPDAMYYNTADPTDKGSMRVDWSVSSIYGIALCNEFGIIYSATPTRSIEAPDAPSDKDIWIDYHDNMYIYHADTAEWVKTQPYVIIRTDDDRKLDLPDLIKAGDVVEITGGYDFRGISGDREIKKIGLWGMGESYFGVEIVIPGVIYTAPRESVSATLNIRRHVPYMDFVVECQNRLWGCKYGIIDGKQVNELYACALGDFKNWYKYQGISTDSWAASVGSSGAFTGAITYMGYPMFFKEDRVHRIAVSPNGAHQVTETLMNGVQNGSANSLAVMDNVLYYKSIDGVYAYQGGFPTKISDALGNAAYSSAAAGSIGHRLYISMRDQIYGRHLFVYDADRRLWMREDDLPAAQFARVGSKLYCITQPLFADNSKIIMLYDNQQTSYESDETTVEWSCETGIQYYEYPDHKYLSRYNIRLSMAKGAHMDIFFEYDSSGRWERAGEIRFSGTDTVTIPIRPRRCDHMRMKLSGEGDVRVYSIARILEVGSDV